MLKNRRIVILIISIIFIIGIFFIIFKSDMSKNFKIGNNTSSQEIVNNILNITSYQSKIEVEVNSNKNQSKYIIKQTYNGVEDHVQEVLEPSNICGVKIIKKGKELKLENSHLNLSSIYENYQYISENSLDLSTFIQEYKEDLKAEWQEKDGKIVMQTSNGDKIKRYKMLYINKENGLPEKMEIYDDSKKIVVYILYNEVSVNS